MVARVVTPGAPDDRRERRPKTIAKMKMTTEAMTANSLPQPASLSILLWRYEPAEKKDIVSSTKKTKAKTSAEEANATAPKMAPIWNGATELLARLDEYPSHKEPVNDRTKTKQPKIDVTM